jgi:hypothetical protein
MASQAINVGLLQCDSLVKAYGQDQFFSSAGKKLKGTRFAARSKSGVLSL